MKALRTLPAVEAVLRELGNATEDLPRPLVVGVVRQTLGEIRRSGKVPLSDTILDRVRRALEDLALTRIQPVINGTGVLIHTNLGRSPLGSSARAAMDRAGRQYNNLELDLRNGSRGGRAGYLEEALAALCRAQAATVVNNCAAALILILRHFTARKPEVLLSRGELVQIGGGFRIPDILEASGATVREVGTTNKTSIKDYERAIGPRTGLLLKVHRSNFFMGGFVSSPETAELSQLARRKRVPFVEDLGSGALTPTEKLGALEHEPTPGECLHQGVDLVCFSGDKLLGGPQAGIIAGKRKWVTGLKREPFYRALRCDKLILSGLQAVAEDYLKAGKAPLGDLPLHALMAVSLDTLEARAQAIRKALRGLPAAVTTGKSTARMGGGTQPRSKIPSIAIDIKPDTLSMEQLSERLRRGCVPVIGHVSGNTLKIDLRTVFPEQDEVLTERLRAALED